MFAVKGYCTKMLNDAKEEVEVPAMLNMIEPLEFKLDAISDLEKKSVLGCRKCIRTIIKFVNMEFQSLI